MITNIAKTIQVLEYYESRGIPCECAPFVKYAVEIMESHPGFKRAKEDLLALAEEEVNLAQRRYASSVDNYTPIGKWRVGVNRQVLEAAWDKRDAIKARFFKEESA